MDTYRIVALDGGGCRGVVTAVFLRHLAEAIPNWVPRVDMFAGSSIGAANAVSLASPDHDPDGMVDFYRDRAPRLFARRYGPAGVGGRLLRLVERLPLLGPLVEKGADLFYPKWSPAGLDEELRGYFGTSTTLGDLDPKRLVITTLHLTGYLEHIDADVVLPTCMTNFPGSPFRDLPVHQALQRSMSAPTFFPSTDDRFVDGGVFANNPGVAAIGAAIEYGGRKLEDIRMLSIGTGIVADAVPGAGPLAWGIAGWGTHFPDASLRSVSEFDHLQCRAILGPDRYCRLNVALSADVAVDDYTSIQHLVEEAERAVESEAFDDAVRFVQEHFAA